MFNSLVKSIGMKYLNVHKSNIDVRGFLHITLITKSNVPVIFDLICENYIKSNFGRNFLK